MAATSSRLRIIAQPTSYARERYSSETNPRQRRPLRYIRAEDNGNSTYPYPTVEIPEEWRNQPIYIRVTSVTVASDNIPYRCIHPYPIDTPEAGVIKDPLRNALFFPVSAPELTDGRKSFQICCKKVLLPDLRSHFPLYLYNRDETEVRRDDRHGREWIDLYQLKKSQLVFTVGRVFPTLDLPLVYEASSAYSITMSPQTTFSCGRDAEVRCAPRTGDWLGGDEILMVIPRLNRRQALEVHFEDLEMNSIIPVPITHVATKTITFQTPRCPRELIGNQTLSIPIVVTQNREEVGRVNFLYRSVGRCIQCQLLVGLPSASGEETVPV